LGDGVDCPNLREDLGPILGTKQSIFNEDAEKHIGICLVSKCIPTGDSTAKEQLFKQNNGDYFLVCPYAFVMTALTLFNKTFNNGVVSPNLNKSI